MCLSVCLSVCYHVFCDYVQRDNKTAIPTGSSLHWLHLKKGDFRITAEFKSYGVKSNKPICKLAQAYLDRVCVSCRQKKSQRRACIDSRMLSTTTPSPCQTLRELLADTTSKGIQSPAHQLVLPRMRSSPRVCTLVLFIHRVKVPPRKVSHAVKACGIYPGAVVVRGNDWKPAWKDQDGKPL